MPRNLNQFSEFQLGFIQAIADAVGGFVVLVMEQESASAVVRSKSGMAFFQWRHGEDPKLWNGIGYISLYSANWTLPEYLYSLNNPSDQLRRVADALNDLIDGGAFDRLDDAINDIHEAASDSAASIAKFFDSLGDATVDSEDDEDDGS